jgi:hypothetical protein
MSAYLGIAYEYFFKDHPQQFFACLQTISEGAQYFGRLSDKALVVAKNIANKSALLQTGLGIPLAFLNFRNVYDRRYKIVTYIKRSNSAELKEVKTKPMPAWLEMCSAVSSGAGLFNFTRQHIFDANASSFAKTIKTVAGIARDGYDLYNFYGERKKESKKIITLDIQTMSFLCQRVSSLFLAGLSLISIYRGVDNPAPLLSLFLTTVYLGSHFTLYYKTHPHPERRIKVIQD